MKTFLSIYRTCLHDQNGPLVSVHFQLNYLIYSFISKIKGNISVLSVPNRSKHYGPTVLGALLFLSFPLAAWHHFQLVKTQTVNILQAPLQFSLGYRCSVRPRNAVPTHQHLFYVQTFSYEYPVFQFDCVNRFFYLIAYLHNYAAHLFLVYAKGILRYVLTTITVNIL